MGVAENEDMMNIPYLFLSFLRQVHKTIENNGLVKLVHQTFVADVSNISLVERSHIMAFHCVEHSLCKSFNVHSYLLLTMHSHRNA